MKNIFILTLILLSLFTTACYQDTEGCLDPYAVNYDLSVDMSCEDCCTYPSFSVSTLHRYDSTRLDQDSLYSNLLGQKYLIKSMDFYIRNIRLVTEAGAEIGINDSLSIPLLSGDTINIENNIFQLNPDVRNVFNVAMKNTSLGIKSVEEDITGIKFNIGLLDLANTIDINKIDSTHFLATSVSIFYDTLNMRYHNVSFSYALDTIQTAEIKTIYIDNDINLNLPIVFPHINNLGKNINYRINIDYKVLFDNIDFENDDIEEIQHKWQENTNYAFKIIE